MGTIKLVAGSGAGATWTNAISAATLNSLANGNAILSDLQIDNSVNLDMYYDLSFNFGSITIAVPAFLGVYLYPLNKDGTTYGDSKFGTAAAGPPPQQYWHGNIFCPTGAAASTGTLLAKPLPFGKFKWVFYNQLGNTLAAAGANTIQYRTFNLQD